MLDARFLASSVLFRKYDVNIETIAPGFSLVKPGEYLLPEPIYRFPKVWILGNLFAKHDSSASIPIDALKILP